MITEAIKLLWGILNNVHAKIWKQFFLNYSSKITISVHILTTIRQIWSPGLRPAPFQASSVDADASNLWKSKIIAD